MLLFLSFIFLGGGFLFCYFCGGIDNRHVEMGRTSLHRHALSVGSFLLLFQSCFLENKEKTRLFSALRLPCALD
jgi:amino acid permease